MPLFMKEISPLPWLKKSVSLLTSGIKVCENLSQSDKEMCQRGYKVVKASWLPTIVGIKILYCLAPKLCFFFPNFNLWGDY